MATFTSLYEKYASATTSMKQEEVASILSPYTQLFNVKIENNKLLIANHNNPLNTIAINRIKAIVIEEDTLYIILPNSIYVLNKISGEVELNIR